MAENQTYLSAFTFKNNVSKPFTNKNGKEMVSVNLVSSKLEKNQKLALTISPKLIFSYSKSTVPGRTFAQSPDPEKGSFVKISIPEFPENETIQLVRTTSNKLENGEWDNKKEIVELTKDQFKKVLFETTEKATAFVRGNEQDFKVVDVKEQEMEENDSEMDFE